MKRVGGSIVVMGLVAVLSSCYPGEISNVGETDLVVTGARPEYSFSKKTYFMPDTVFYIQSDSMAPDTFDHEFDELIVSTVAGELAQYGYSRTEDVDAADIQVINAIMINVNMTIWTWWPGYYPPYWGCCYGGYPWWPVTGGTVWRSGTVATLMRDKAEEVPDQDEGIVWVGGLNGLAEGGGGAQRISSGIIQAFDQSPYLAGGTPSPAN